MKWSLFGKFPVHVIIFVAMYWVHECHFESGSKPQSLCKDCNDNDQGTRATFPLPAPCAAFNQLVWLCVRGGGWLLFQRTSLCNTEILGLPLVGSIGIFFLMGMIIISTYIFTYKSCIYNARKLVGGSWMSKHFIIQNIKINEKTHWEFFFPQCTGPCKKIK